MRTAHIGDDGLVDLVSADTHRMREHDIAKRQDRHLGGAAADIDHHRARRLGHRQRGADRGGHRLFDQEDPACAGSLGRFLNGPALNRSGARRHANNHLRAGEIQPAVHLADEVLDHFFGNFEIGDHTVRHRADGADVAGGLAEHHLGFLADGKHLRASANLGHGHNRRLVEHDALALYVDKCVCRTEVNADVCREYIKHRSEHANSPAPPIRPVL